MAGQQGNQGSGNQQGNQTDSGRGFAGMDDDQQREIARQGGEASARSQDRDDQGQFAGSNTGSGSSGSSKSGSGSSRGGGSKGR